MKYIFGLGNPGEKFELTRHNSGFIMLNKIQRDFNFPRFELNKKVQADLSKGKINDTDVILVKSRVFMNESGKTAQSLLDFYKGAAQDIIVIHDDIDLMLGKNKISCDSGSAGHNGVRDIIEKIGTKKFMRIRVGVANERIRSQTDPSDFVLQKFSPEELKVLENSIRDIFSQLHDLVK